MTNDDIQQWATEAQRVATEIASSPALSRLVKMQQDMERALDPLRVQWQRLGQDLARIVMGPLLSPQIIQAMQSLTRMRLPNFEKWMETWLEATEILVSHGWWPHPNWPVSAFGEVIELRRNRQLRRLDSEICDSYETNRFRPMRSAISQWIELPEFQKRRRMFEDGLWAYRRRRYGLAVTHWLPQIEGVLLEYLVRTQMSPPRARRLDPKSRQRVRQQIVGDGSSLTDAFATVIASLYGDRTGKSAPARPFPFERNSVLHGTNLRFGTRANAMRTFLMLDAIHYFIDEFERRRKAA